MAIIENLRNGPLFSGGASGTVIRTLLLGICLVCLPEFGEATTYSTGNGHNGALIISASRVEDTTLGLSNITVSAASGQKNVSLTNAASASQFSIGDLIFLIQMQGTGVGQYEFNTIENIVSNILVLKSNLVNSYGSTGAQVIKVGEYSSVSINSGGSWSASARNGTTGGVLVAVSSGNIILNSGGSIGYIGGFFGGTCGSRPNIYPECTDGASQGYGVSGTPPITLPWTWSRLSNGNGGGAGRSSSLPYPAGGGGGGNATTGTNGVGSDNDGGQWGNGGNAAGAATLENAMVMGGGGGGGGFNVSAGPKVYSFRRD